MLIVVINNIISFLLTLAIVFVAPLIIAYAGFLMVVNPTSAGNVSKARSILWNVVEGIVIALAAWLIVDAIMAAFYNANAPNNSGGFIGTWSTLVTSGNTGDLCLPQSGTSSGPPASTPSVTSGAGNQTLSSGTRACDASVVQQGAQTGGYTLTTAQANTLACLARPESSCGFANLNYRWGSGSSAAGAFQVLLSTNSACYNNPACEQAAGTPGQPLNCATGFSGGNPKTDPASQAIVQKCLQASASVACSASAAACLLQQNNGSFKPWTGNADSSSAAQQCVATFLVLL